MLENSGAFEGKHFGDCPVLNWVRKGIVRRLMHFLILTFLVIATSVTGQTDDDDGIELIVQTGHPGGVSAFEFSPDARLAASGGMDGTVKLWDIRTRRVLRSLKGHDDSLRLIKFSQEGELLATVEERGSLLILWEVATGRKKWEVLLGGESVSFSPNSKLLVSEFGVWDVETGEMPEFLGRPEIEGQQPDVGPIAISPDGRSLAIVNADGSVSVWDPVKEKELKSFEGHAGHTRALAFSPDGTILASAGEDGKVILWDAYTGEIRGNPLDTSKAAYSIFFSPDGKYLAAGGQVFNVERQSKALILGDRNDPGSLVFSPDGRLLAAAGFDEKSISLWELATSRKIETSLTRRNFSGIYRPSFSPDGRFLVFGNALWDVENRRNAMFLGERGDFAGAAFSNDGAILALSRRAEIELWDLPSGTELGPLRGRAEWIEELSFSKDGRFLGSSDSSGALRLWEIERIGESKLLDSKDDFIYHFVFSPDGRTLASHQMGRIGYSVKLWDIGSGKAISTFETDDRLETLSFSPSGRFLISGSEVRDLNTGKKVELPTAKRGEPGISISSDESWVAIIDRWAANEFRPLLKLREIRTGAEKELENPGEDLAGPLAFSPDGRFLAAAGSENPYLVVWNTGSGRVQRVIEDDYDHAWTHEPIPAESVLFSPDGRIVAADRGENNPIGLWEVATGTAIDYETLPDWVRFSGSFAVSNINGRMIRAETDGARIVLEDADSEKPLASIVAFDRSDWAVSTPEGLFDATPGGREMMHYVLGLEPVALEQIKDVYYVPGLLRKILKGEPLPKVDLFTSKDLFPEVEFTYRENERLLDITLRDRGGGIGPVQVLVNRKEFVADARPAGFDPGVKETFLTVGLEGAPFLPGSENRIEVVARNREGSLSNKGTPKGSESVSVSGDEGELSAPDVYAIVAGVSDYTGDALDLRFAAKDAEDFAKAVELGALKLKGDPEKVHIRLLTAGGRGTEFTVPDAKTARATKDDFRRAFEDFRGAKPEDIFIVYLSGHGTSVNLNADPARSGGDTYLYMTQEATTTSRDVLLVSGARKAMTLSSDEIKEMMKQNRALKQILILDTCAAGAAVESLVGRRDMPSDQIKALERLKDNTGSFVLMGSAADRVSYEASKYGQGLLTYSLLEAMKGARLRDGEYAYVGDLFSYAQEKVPQLAANIGGVQRPLVITPDASGNFPFGRFTEAERNGIRLSSPKPQILRPSLQNEKLRFDNLRLEQLLSRKLRELSYVSVRGRTEAPLVFVDAGEMSDAIRPSGSYTSENGVLTIRLVLVRNNELVGEEITASGSSDDPAQVIDSLLDAFIRAIKESH
ncbi:MAG TPA: caspase family protein [Aridibacter sp.]|nr:caspase family protein [Aridibacter sp.]